MPPLPRIKLTALKGGQIPWLASPKGPGNEYYPFIVHHKKAELLEMLGEWGRAEGIYRQNLDWLDANRFDAQAAIGRLKLGWVLHKKGQGREALAQLTMAEPVLAEDRTRPELCDLYNSIGNTHYRLGDYPKAEDYLRRSQELAREQGDPERESNALNNLGNVYGDQGDIDRALEHYWRSYEIGERLRERYGNAKTAGNIAWCYFAKNDFPQAMDWYRRQAAVAGECGDKHLLSVAIGNMVAIFLSLGEHEKAREHIERRLRLAKELGDKRGISISLSHLGHLHRTKGDYPAAEGCLQQAIVLARELEAKYFLSLYLNEQAQLCQETSQPERALASNREALALAREINVPKLIVDCSILQAKLLSNRDRKEARLILEGLSGVRMDLRQEARVQLEMYRLTGAEEHRQKALDSYRTIVRNCGEPEDQKAINELENQNGRA